MVSIVAVFLAAAVGIVLGTTTLNGVVLRDLNKRVTSLSNDKDALHSQLEQARTTIQRDDAFAAAAQPRLIAGRLSGQRVVIIRAPGASGSLRDQLANAVEAAGGDVVASIDLGADYADPANARRLGQLATSVVPPGVTLPAGESPAQQAASVLAHVLMTRHDQTPSTQQSKRLADVLTAFGSAQLLQVNGSTPTPGDLALVVSADPPGESPSPSPSATATGDALIDLVGELDALGDGAVVAGSADAAAAGSLLSDVRGSGIADTVSTVDSVDSPRGVVAAVLALAAQPHGQSGAYGGAAAGDAPLPTPSP